jgi:hypothetical protein
MEERMLAAGDELLIDGVGRLTVLAIEKGEVLLAVSLMAPEPVRQAEEESGGGKECRSRPYGDCR